MLTVIKQVPAAQNGQDIKTCRLHASKQQLLSADTFEAH
jgi:hypothetical protein